MFGYGIHCGSKLITIVGVWSIGIIISCAFYTIPVTNVNKFYYEPVNNVQAAKLDDRIYIKCDDIKFILEIHDVKTYNSFDINKVKKKVRFNMYGQEMPAILEYVTN